MAVSDHWFEEDEDVLVMPEGLSQQEREDWLWANDRAAYWREQPGGPVPESFAGGFQVPFPDILNDRSRRSLELQIGHPVTCRSEARAVMADKGLRFVEQGDATHQAVRRVKEWRESGSNVEERGGFLPRKKAGPPKVKQRMVDIYREKFCT